MSPGRFFRGTGSALAVCLGLLACSGDSNVAGGSSEVDNPQVRVAFVDSTGTEVAFTGSLSLFLADQNPALDPDPLLKRQVAGSASVHLSSRDFAQGDADSMRAYNILLIGEDTMGALLQNLSYNPATRKYRFRDTNGVTELRVPLVRLVRYEAFVNVSGDTGIVRVIIPGTPFQAVVVDSAFVIEGVPGGDSLPLHVLEQDGSEKPLTAAPPPGPGPAPHHEVDTTKPAVIRPPAPPPGDSLVVSAGGDRTVFLGMEVFLDGTVTGIDPKNPKLSVQWRQVPPGSPQDRAFIESPTALKTKVSFSRPGAYRFVLSAVAGSRQTHDTVIVGVEGSPLPASFIEPIEGDTLFLGEPFRIVWQTPQPKAAALQLSRDSGATWQPLQGGNPPPRAGFSEWLWVPSGTAAPHCFLRLQEGNGTVVAVSKRFALRVR